MDTSGAFLLGASSLWHAAAAAVKAAARRPGSLSIAVINTPLEYNEPYHDALFFFPPLPPIQLQPLPLVLPPSTAVI